MDGKAAKRSARLQIRGAKGGKGGGGGRAPVEAPDSLRSRAYARVVDLVSEGEIAGLVTGDARSILLDGVPLLNQDEAQTPNFADVRVDWRYGTQGQTAMDGFAAQESEQAVNTQVTSATPVVRTITNANVDTVRVTLSFPVLSFTDVSNGDVSGTSVEFAIDVQSNGGGYVEQFRQTITGKTVNGYQRSVRLPLPGGPPWDLRVRRITADSSSQYLQNASWWASYTEIISTRLRYPNSAVVGIAIDAQQFARIPVRGYDLMGLRLRVPVNYDPIARSYSGVWDGTFKIAWSNNPAWCFYELVTNPRWGLGRFVDTALVNKWSLYKIAQYCDGPVPNGKGGTEPRFTLNAYLQTQVEAYDLVQALASVFRAMVFWGPGGIDLAQDAPADAVALLTNANVVDGVFEYQDSSARQRHTVAIVQWNDPLDQFRARQVYVEDAEGIARYGVIPTQVVAFGCTSHGQAVRAGRWLLYSEIHETEAVAFRVGMEGVLAAPGQVIRIADRNKANERTGGRIAAATATSVTVDAPVQINAGETYTLLVLDPDGANPVVSRGLTNAPGTHQVLTLAAALPAVPTTQSVWVLSSDLVIATWWRVVAVSEIDGSNEFAVTALAHNPSKFAAIEQGLKLESYPVSRLTAAAQKPAFLTLREFAVTDKDGSVRIRLAVSWVPQQAGGLFRVSWRRAAGAWRSEPDTPQQSIDLLDVTVGDYDVEVRAVSISGAVSPPVAASITLDGKTDGPVAPTPLLVSVAGDGTRIYQWVMPPPLPGDLAGFELRFCEGATGEWDDMDPLFVLAAAGRGASNVWREDTVSPDDPGTYSFAIKAIDSSGNYSAAATYALNVTLPMVGIGAGPAVVVDAPTQLFKVDKDGNATNASITLTATLQGGLAGTVVWSAGAGYVGTPPTGTNTWQVMAADQVADAVTYTATMTEGGNEYQDSITLVRLRDGVDSLVAVLTNEAHTVPASSSGVVSAFTGASGQMRVYRGATRLLTGVAYSVFSNPQGVSTTIGASSGNYSVSGAGTWPAEENVASVTYRATIDSITLDRVFSLTKSRAGATGATGATGAQGPAGAAGPRGATWISAATAGTAWSDSVANAALAAAGYGAPQMLDRVTLYNTGAAYSETRFYDGAAWLTIALFLAGNAFIDGTVAATKLIAQSITTQQLQVTAVSNNLVQLAPAPRSGNFGGASSGSIDYKLASITASAAGLGSRLTLTGELLVEIHNPPAPVGTWIEYEIWEIEGSTLQGGWVKARGLATAIGEPYGAWGYRIPINVTATVNPSAGVHTNYGFRVYLSLRDPSSVLFSQLGAWQTKHQISYAENKV